MSNSTPTTIVRYTTAPADYDGFVRSHPKLGKGSCSTVDESMTDDELIEEFLNWLILKTSERRVYEFGRHMKLIERATQDRAEDIRLA